MSNNVKDAAVAPGKPLSPESPKGGSGVAENRNEERRQDERRQEERRRNQRYTVSVQMEGIELQSRARFAGRISDISLGGAYIDTITSLPVGSTIKIRVKAEGKTFDTKAQVTICSAGMGMGVRFLETEPAQVEILKQWIRELNGEGRADEPEFEEAPGPQSPAATTAGDAVLTKAVSSLIVELIKSGVLPEQKGRAILETLSSGAGKH